MKNNRLNFDSIPNVPLEVEELLKARKSLDHLINDTGPLLNKDYELIGRFVQTYSVADLEARRVINCLKHIQQGEPTAFAQKLNDKDTLDHLMDSADSCSWNPNLALGIRRAAEILVLHRKIRHIFAHWTGRRIPNYDFFIFFTSSLGKQELPKEVFKIEDEENANIQYALMPISNVLEEQVKLEKHVAILSECSC